jgi:hypothetical protein
LKTAIRKAAFLSIVIGAPRTIGRGGFLKADDGRKHTKDDKKILMAISNHEAD